jgi:hypothetical protein
MMMLPVTVLDDFFEDPDSIRAHALAQTFAPDPQGRWPGTRTDNLAELHPQLFDHVCRRVASLFYRTRNQQEHVMWRASGGFQLVDAVYGQGWVHHDAFNELFTAIIYLTPDADQDSGTSIMERRDRTTTIPKHLEDAKRTSILTCVDDPNSRDELAAYYDEVIRVNNKYNRIVIFDSHLYHRANEFAASDTPRLTLTLFFSALSSSELSPVQRLRREVD